MTTLYTATNGNDSNLGTEAQPFRTIVYGVGLLEPGDTLFVRAGEYIESLWDTFPSGLSWAEPITLAVYPGEPVEIKPAGGLKVIRFAKSQYNIVDGFVLDGENVEEEVLKITSEAHHIRIINTEVKGAPRQGVLIVTFGAIPSDFNEFINLNIHDNGLTWLDHGIYIATSNNIIEKSLVHHNAGYGVHIYAVGGGVNNNMARRNKCYENARSGQGSGIILSSGSGNKAHQNLVWGNKSGITIAFQGVIDAEAYNNTIYENSARGIDIGADSKRALLRNNIVYQNSWSDIADAGSGTIKENNLEGVDPQFVNALMRDFHLEPTSPARDAGLWVGLHIDFDSVVIPQGSAPDIGAYEFQEGSSLMPVLDDLIAIEAALRQEVLDITAQADAVAQAIVDLRAVDDALDAAADVIEAD